MCDGGAPAAGVSSFFGVSQKSVARIARGALAVPHSLKRPLSVCTIRYKLDGKEYIKQVHMVIQSDVGRLLLHNPLFRLGSVTLSGEGMSPIEI